jgi:glutamate racemase
MPNPKNKNIIGVFDSGLGGLTVLKSLLKKLPDYNYIYLGDNARLPYGNKSKELIYEYTRQAVDFLFARGCNLIIIACNSASADALRKIQQSYLPKKYPGKNVLGVIRPLAEKFAATGMKKIGVIGTAATIGSDVYPVEVHKLNKKLKVYQQSAPLLVPLIEENWMRHPETKTILKKYLTPLKNKKIEALILGCTHYPFLINDARKIMGKTCAVPGPGEIVAASLADYLARHRGYGLKPVRQPLYKFYVTDDAKKFKKLGEKFLGSKIRLIEKIAL